MHYAFENMHYYINMWYAVMVNDLFHDFCGVANDESTLQVRCAPEFLIIELDHVVDARRYGFTLDTYIDELCSARELTFSRRYYLGSFVEKGDTPFR